MLNGEILYIMFSNSESITMKTNICIISLFKFFDFLLHNLHPGINTTKISIQTIKEVELETPHKVVVEVDKIKCETKKQYRRL